MKVLDSRLDNKPTPEDVRELAELRIQNLLCFKELQALNDTGRFVCKHPILRNKVEYSALVELWNKDRGGFLRRYDNCRNSIRRYSGRTNRKNATEEDKDAAYEQLIKHQQRADLFKKIINHESNDYHL